MKVSVSASGSADPETVWDRYVRPARWPQWSPQIRSVDYPGEVIAAGGHGVVHGPCGVPVAFEILEVDVDDHSWRWQVTLVGITLTLDHVVAAGPAGAAGTTTRLDITGPAPVVLAYAPIARLALGRLVR